MGDEMHPEVEGAAPGHLDRTQAPPSGPAIERPADSPPPSTKHMVMLTNHGAALLYLHAHPDARVRDVADALHITERATARILADLKASGHLQVTHASRRNHYLVTGTLPLHPGEATCSTMADLVRRISSLTMSALVSTPVAF